MDATTILGQLDALLDEEQDAIVRIDGAAVEAIANRKLALVESLQQVEPRPDADSMRHLVRRLRHNGVLLAHARHCLRDVVQTLSAPIGPASGQYDPHGRAAVAPSSRISVTG